MGTHVSVVDVEVDVEAFYISKTPVTNEEFEVFRPGRARPAWAQGDTDPACGLTWEDAQGYCAWYAAWTGKPFRLPTEIEWEYACRADSEGPHYASSPTAIEAATLHAGNSEGRLWGVEQRVKNGFGLHDMLGTVWEWTSSPYRPYPLCGDGVEGEGQFVLRGGSFREPLAHISCSIRRVEARDVVIEDAGFRVVRGLS